MVTTKKKLLLIPHTNYHCILVFFFQKGFFNQYDNIVQRMFIGKYKQQIQIKFLPDDSKEQPR